MPSGTDKETIMQSITINISNDKLAEKITRLLEHFKNDGLEIMSKKDMDDLKLLKATRREKVFSFNKF
jgi:Txe/YoeB family toxin of Txe-Axe toxin-antitoxin module